MTHNPGPQQPPAPQPTWQPTAPQPRKGWFARHKVLTTIGVLVLLGIIVSAANGGSGTTGTPAAGTAAPSTSAAAAPATVAAAAADQAAPAADAVGIGTAVADGKFEFTVTQLEPGGTHIGPEGYGADAQGQFVLVHLTVRNIGNEAQYFDGSSQTLVDSKGRKFSADTSAAIYLDQSNSFLNQINPGNQVEGVVVFDVPADATLVTITLHDSMFSGGVDVRLT